MTGLTSTFITWIMAVFVAFELLEDLGGMEELFNRFF